MWREIFAGGLREFNFADRRDHIRWINVPTAVLFSYGKISSYGNCLGQRQETRQNLNSKSVIAPCSYKRT